MATPFDTFFASLPVPSRTLLEDVALFVRRKSPVKITLDGATFHIRRAMPYLTPPEAEALGYCAIKALEKDDAQMIKLQMNMQRENTVFTSVSNVLKTRHDSAKNAISN